MGRLQFVFRAPVFPVILKDRTRAVCVMTPAELESYFECNAKEMPAQCELIDYDWEGWNLHTKEAMVCPSFANRSYTKRDLLLLCGSSEEQLANTNLNKYTRKQIFDALVEQSRRKVK